MKQLSDLSIGQTAFVGGKRKVMLHAVSLRQRFTIGTWQRVGMNCPLVDFFAQEEPDAPMLAFRIIGQERKI